MAVEHHESFRYIESPALHPRIGVYDAIEREIVSEDQKFGFLDNHDGPSLTEWLVYMQDYLTEAVRIAARQPDDKSNPLVLDKIRKITAMGVLALEQHS